MISLTLRGSDQSTQGETGLLQDGKKHSRWVYRWGHNPYLAVRAVLMTRTSKWDVDKSALQDAEHSPAHFQGDLFINRGFVATEACLWDGVTPAVTPYTQSSRYKTGSSGFLVGGTGPRAGKQATALEDRRSMECRLGRTRADGGKVARSSYPLSLV